MLPWGVDSDHRRPQMLRPTPPWATPQSTGQPSTSSPRRPRASAQLAQQLPGMAAARFAPQHPISQAGRTGLPSSTGRQVHRDAKAGGRNPPAPTLRPVPLGTKEGSLTARPVRTARVLPQQSPGGNNRNHGTLAGQTVQARKALLSLLTRASPSGATWCRTQLLPAKPPPDTHTMKRGKKAKL